MPDVMHHFTTQDYAVKLINATYYATFLHVAILYKALFYAIFMVS